MGSMQRLPVESTDIVSIGYDEKTRVLEIEFKENRVYRYFDVEPDVYERFTRTDSYGEYLHAHILKHYRYQKVAETPQKSEALGKLAFVTGNARKFRDLQHACETFGIEVEQLDLPVDEIQSHDPERIALQKAKDAYRLATRPVVVNDSFWNILALRGFPGAFMSYMAEWFKAEDFLALMSGKKDKTIICTDTIAYYDGNRSKVFSENTAGKIIDEPRGKGRETLDQIVIMSGQTQTVAEIEDAHGRSSFNVPDSIYGQFAKWYNLQKRLGKV
jgi:non-canonical purine NTP pyrophosphatase (RdgB/HAM1 family)